MSPILGRDMYIVQRQPMSMTDENFILTSWLLNIDAATTKPASSQVIELKYCADRGDTRMWSSFVTDRDEIKINVHKNHVSQLTIKAKHCTCPKLLVENLKNKVFV